MTLPGQDLPDWLTAQGWITQPLVTFLNMQPVMHQDLSVGQFGTLWIACDRGALPAAATSLEVLQYPDAVVPLAKFNNSADYLTAVGGSGGNGRWLYPVWGGSVRLTNNGANPFDLYVWGSTRVFDRPQIIAEQAAARDLVITAALVAGTPVPFVANDGFVDSTAFNGMTEIITGSNLPAGQIGMTYTAIDGTTQTKTVARPTGAGGEIFSVPCPRGRVSWVFVPTANGAAATRHLFLASASS